MSLFSYRYKLCNDVGYIERMPDLSLTLIIIKQETERKARDVQIFKDEQFMYLGYTSRFFSTAELRRAVFRARSLLFYSGDKN